MATVFFDTRHSVDSPLDLPSLTFVAATRRRRRRCARRFLLLTVSWTTHVLWHGQRRRTEMTRQRGAPDIRIPHTFGSNATFTYNYDRLQNVETQKVAIQQCTTSTTTHPATTTTATKPATTTATNAHPQNTTHSQMQNLAGQSQAVGPSASMRQYGAVRICSSTTSVISTTLVVDCDTRYWPRRHSRAQHKRHSARHEF